MALDKVLYTAQASATGGREGRATSEDGVIDFKLTTPKGLGGAGGEGTNPEQLFAAGYAACFLNAVKLVASREKIAFPADAKIDARVGIGQAGEGYGLQVELKASFPGLSDDQSRDLIERAHVVCPYSNATRGNVDVTLSVA